MTLVALADELEKIAAEQPQKPDRKKALKRALKTVAIVGTGYAAGHAAGMVTDHVLKKTMGDKWKRWSTPTKRKILIPALGITTAAAAAANAHLNKKRQQAKQNG